MYLSKRALALSGSSCDKYSLRIIKTSFSWVSRSVFLTVSSSFLMLIALGVRVVPGPQPADSPVPALLVAWCGHEATDRLCLHELIILDLQKPLGDQIVYQSFALTLVHKLGDQ